MKLLLIYPQLADKRKRRVSREDTQFIGLTHTTRALLANGKTRKLGIHEHAYNNYISDVALQSNAKRKQLRSIYNKFDLVIDISPAALVNTVQAEIDVPVIHLSPTFSGSFACNDITIKGRGNLQQSDIVQCISQNTDQNLGPLPSTHELTAEMHRSTCSPLPTRVGDAFYRSAKEHALVLLAYPDHCRNDQTIATDIQVLKKMLHGVKDLKSITFICDRLEDVPLVQQVVDGVMKSVRIRPSIWGIRKGEFHDLFSIMAKSSVVFIGGGALFADAIICKIPVYLWRNDLYGHENIAQAYRQFASHQFEPINRNPVSRLNRSQQSGILLPSVRRPN